MNSVLANEEPITVAEATREFPGRRRMSIDLTTETPKTLAKAAHTLPGGAVHVSTMHRWRMKGVRGVRLETFLRGGIRYTTDEAIRRFFAATTAAADGDTPPVRTIAQRERAIQQAERACERAGI
ncbi:MAG: DUF1580 domain-containing protein [Pirellulaceae bacterium]